MQTQVKLNNTEFTGIVNSKGGLFDVSNKEMEANIGRKCKYITVTCGIEKEIFTVEGIQKNYKGDTIYRLTFEGDTFGRPCSPELIEFI